MGLYQSKFFCTAKETFNKMKTQSSGSEKIFANNTFDKESTCKIYKELIKLNTKIAKQNKINKQKITNQFN